MVSKTKSRSAVAVAPPPPTEHIKAENPFAMFKIEKIGRHYNGYMHIQRKGNAPAYWKPLFPAATILSSILGALEREISDAAIQL